MELFREIRLKIGNSILSKKTGKVKRKVFYSNISRIKSIGIVWDASKPEDFVNLSEFHQNMNERNINVSIVGYYPGKELPDEYTALRYLSCIRRKELNLYYIPVSEETNTFINKMYDILIDINFDKIFPLSYISTLSKASFKVGLFEPGTNGNPFDMMIELKKPVSIMDYLNNVVHYLEMIDSGSSVEIDKIQS